MFQEHAHKPRADMDCKRCGKVNRILRQGR